MIKSILLLVASVVSIASAVADTTGVDTNSKGMTDSALYAYRLDSMRIESEHYLRLNREGSTNPRPDDFVPFVAMLIPLSTIIALSIIVYRRNEARKIERLAMIERGVDPSLFMVNEREGTRKYSALRTGMFLAGIGFGLLAGALMAMNVEREWIPLVIISPSILFGGVGLIAYHVIAKKMEKVG